MDNLDEIIEVIHSSFEKRTAARDQTLSQARLLTRKCAMTIRAVHRNELATANNLLNESIILVDALNANIDSHPELYFTGYTQDALKEYAEAQITKDLIEKKSLPTPDELKLTDTTYLKGLAEAAGELRRYCLDSLRTNQTEEAERLLGYMDEIYSALVTMDYPDAITRGLRRLTDIVRAVTERTRGDLTISLRQERLEKKLQQLEEGISK